MVVADSIRARDGRFIERVGFYDPKAPEGREALRVDLERVKHWTGKGAKLSPTVTRLVKQFQIVNGLKPELIGAAIRGEHVGSIVYCD